MEKVWLIRTKTNHILGPISKEKAVELYQNGSIQPDDEICSGNGYWFFIREKDLVERYLLGQEIQGFNPISEAKDTLKKKELNCSTTEQTIVGGENILQALKEPPAPKEEIKIKVETKPVLKESPHPAAVAVVNNPSLHSKPVSSTPPSGRVRKKVIRVASPSTTTLTAPTQSQAYLKILGILGFILLVCLVYFRKTIIKKITEFNFIEKVHAQEELDKKKSS